MEEKKKKGGIVKWIIIAVIAIVVIAAVSGGEEEKPKKVGDSKTESTTGKGDKNNSTVEKEFFSKGEVAELNDIQVTLTDYKESTGSEWNKPADGKVFLLAEFEIVNNSDDEITVSSMLSFEAYADDYALEYSFGAMLEQEGTQLDATVGAGKKLKGWIGYEVPADYKKVEIQFVESLWEDTPFEFQITK